MSKSSVSTVERGSSHFVRYFTAVLLLVMSVLSLSVSVFTPAAYATDEEVQSQIKGAMDGQVAKDAEGNPDFLKTFDQVQKDPNKNDIVKLLFDRMIVPGYLNNTADGTAANGYAAREWNCDVNAKGAGTPLYHNCDVPNLMTEFIQTAVSFFSQQGPRNAETTSATLTFPEFGLPNGIPNGGAPAVPAERMSKFTALELFGYNLNFTSYAGEWDNIKVMSKARTMSNFGFMDNLKMSTDAMLNGITSSAQETAEGVSSAISSGDVFGALGALVTAPSAGPNATVKTVLDSADLNVFNSSAWYRVGYGATLYNARELSNEEIAGRAKYQLLDMISSSSPEEATIPDDLKSIKDGPDALQRPVASCSVMNPTTGAMEPFGDTTSPPGPSEEDCMVKAKDLNPEASDLKTKYQWSENGTVAGDTLQSWYDRNKSIFDTAAKYGMECKVNTENADVAAEVAAVNTCFLTGWGPAVDKAVFDIQSSNNESWAKDQVNPDNFSAWVSADPKRNFNAPWNRFVCTNPDGTDMRNNAALVYLFNSNGDMNPDCDPVRPPIQNGMFGNGYVEGKQTLPAVDTRTQGGLNFVEILFPQLTDFFSNIGFNIAVFMTRVSNTIINLAFSPIFATIGLDTMIVGFIEQIRDSIFLPLLVVGVSTGVLISMYQALTRRNFRQFITNVGISLAVMAIGIVTLFAPARVVALADEVPASIERVIVGTIFSTGNSTNDELCTTTGSPALERGEGFDGQPLAYNFDEGTRSLTCENWRTFVFNPWVFGQFGTDFSNLYAAGTHPRYGETLQNTNKELVGDAAVPMGNGVVVRNWALYQLDVTSSGTASFPETTVNAGGVSRDFYRIVDAFAGPDGGKASDGRYFDMWSGKTFGGRTIVSALSGTVSALGLITVSVYGIAKIVVTFTTTLMFLIMPFVLLAGLIPQMFRKVKGFLGSIVGLMVQRILLVFILSVMFRVLSTVGSVSSNYFAASVITACICVLFLKLRKKIFNLVFNSVGSSFGSPIGMEFMRDPSVYYKKHVRHGSPGLVENSMQHVSNAVVSSASGAVGGFISGGIAGVVPGAKESVQVNSQRLEKAQRRRGFSKLEQTMKTVRGVSEYTDKRFQNDAFSQSIVDDTRRESAAHQEWQEYQEYLKQLPKKINEQGTWQVYNPETGEFVDNVEMPDFKLDNSLSGRKSIKRVANKRRKSAKDFRAGRGERIKNLDEKIQGSTVDDLKGAVQDTATGRTSKARLDSYRNKDQMDTDSMRDVRERLLEFEDFRYAFSDESRVMREKLDELRSAVEYNNNQSLPKPPAPETNDSGPDTGSGGTNNSGGNAGGSQEAAGSSSGGDGQNDPHQSQGRSQGRSGGRHRDNDGKRRRRK